jgi:hypothetical protein
MFLQKVEIVPGVFDQLLLIGVNRIPPLQGIFQSVTDCSLGCSNFVQQFCWVQLGDSIVIKRLPVAAVLVGDLAYVTQLVDSFSVFIHSGIEREGYRLVADAA